MSDRRNIEQYNEFVNEMTRLMMEGIIEGMRSESVHMPDHDNIDSNMRTRSVRARESPDTNENPVMNLLVSGLDTIFTSTRQRFLDELDEIITEYVSDMSLRESQESIHEECRVDVDLPYTIYSNIEDRKDDKCAICLDIFDSDSKVCLLNCGHVFHKDCIKNWVNIKNTCPTCRVTI